MIAKAVADEIIKNLLDAVGVNDLHHGTRFEPALAQQRAHLNASANGEIFQHRCARLGPDGMGVIAAIHKDCAGTERIGLAVKH